MLLISHSAKKNFGSVHTLHFFPGSATEILNNTAGSIKGYSCYLRYQLGEIKITPPPPPAAPAALRPSTPGSKSSNLYPVISLHNLELMKND